MTDRARRWSVDFPVPAGATISKAGMPEIGAIRSTGPTNGSASEKIANGLSARSSTTSQCQASTLPQVVSLSKGAVLTVSHLMPEGEITSPNPHQ